jgi:CRISPR-associated protein Cas1
MLKGRLGLETARVPHADRHGLIWLGRGQLSVESGTLHFVTAGGAHLDPGSYDIPFQGVSLILLGPGCSLTHDVLRLATRHGCGLVAVGEDGVRMYSAPPVGPDHSKLARIQAKLWADPRTRLALAREMYHWRMGERLEHRSLDALRGIEGSRMREMYQDTARRYGIPWKGRRYDRNQPEATDLANQAINHAASAVQAAAEIAVAATATIPQLGFIHEDSARSFILDIADLHRHTFTVPIAFQAVKDHLKQRQIEMERVVRRLAGKRFRQQKLIPMMIDQVKDLLNAHDSGDNL